MENGADMPPQSVDMGNLYSYSVFDCEIEFRQLQAPSHQTRVLVCEFPKLGRRDPF